jgi:hypothetical protein
VSDEVRLFRPHVDPATPRSLSGVPHNFTRPTAVVSGVVREAAMTLTVNKNLLTGFFVS